MSKTGMDEGPYLMSLHMFPFTDRVEQEFLDLNYDFFEVR